MDNFLIITNMEKDKDLRLTRTIEAYIQKAGKQSYLSQISTVTGNALLKDIISKVECAIVLGGDGTIIQTANDLMAYNIPILGVSLGTVGFLAEIEEHHV